MDLSKIAATLEHGRFLSGKWKLFIKFSLVISIIAVLLTIIVFAFNWGQLGTTGSVFVIVVNTLIFGLFSTYLIYALHRNRDIEKIILDCLNDMVIVDATIQDISESRVRGVYWGIKIQVSFTYEGIKHIRTSGSKKNENKMSNGYDMVFRNYAGRTIPVLYSPAEDQILFLK